jgi:hypothetical protein
MRSQKVPLRHDQASVKPSQAHDLFRKLFRERYSRAAAAIDAWALNASAQMA